MSWKKLSSQVKYKNRFMTVTEEELVTDHGAHVTFGIVHKDPAVLIIPWDGTRATLIGQYRYPTDFYSWEFPAGHCEHDTVESAARAELKEETGYLAGKLTEIGTFHVAPGHNTQVCYVFLAEDLTAGPRELEPSEEGMEMKKATIGEIETMVKDGKIKDGLTLSSLLLFRLFRRSDRV